jgi:hypothetical protein
MTGTYDIAAATQKVPSALGKEFLGIFLHRLHDRGPRQVDRTFREWNINRADVNVSILATILEA